MRSMKRCPFAALLAVGACAALAPDALAVPMEFVAVGDVGNPAGADGRGGVAYPYQIGKYEVTNVQYVEFLNAADPSGANPRGLYNAQMTADASGGILFDALAPAGSRYQVRSGFGRKPVNFVSGFDAMRFANWMNNGQGGADTETGSYSLLGPGQRPTNWRTVARNPEARFAVVSEDEWRKAAYYQPADAGGDVDGYWQYPTGANAMPASDEPPGDPSVHANAANFYRDDGLDNGINGGLAVGAPVFLTDVGAYAGSATHYGTFDQAGNVFEWTDTLDGPGYRISLSGWFAGDASYFSSDYRGNPYPDVELSGVGFRMVVVPEPTTALLAPLLSLLASARIRAAGRSVAPNLRPRDNRATRCDR